MSATRNVRAGGIFAIVFLAFEAHSSQVLRLRNANSIVDRASLVSREKHVAMCSDPNACIALE